MQRGTVARAAALIAATGAYLACTWGVLVTCAVIAEAQAPSHVVVRATADGDGHLAEANDLAEAVAAGLSRADLEAWVPADARTRFEASASAPAFELSASDLQRWVESSRSAVRHLARADYDRARAELLEAHQVASRAAAELNREAARARQVLDTCLFMVRALVETRDEEGALEQARECRQLVPGAEPTPYRHTPEVREILARVDAAMAAEPPGSLTVTSTPSGCQVRLNGISFGVTPFHIDELAPGEFRLQVECGGGRGRIRRVRIGRGVTEVHVDGGFDDRVRSRPTLGFVYPDPSEARERAASDAARVLTALGASDAWMVWHTPEGGRVDRITDAGVYSAWLPNHGPATLDAAIGALSAGRNYDPAGSHSESEAAIAALAAPTPDGLAAPPADREPLGRRARVGLSLLGVGVASYAVGLGLHVRRVHLGDEFAALFALSRQQAWIDARTPSVVVGSVGGALAVAALPLFMPARDGVPVGAVLSGVAGVALIVGGVVHAVRADRCTNFVQTRTACIDGEQRTDRAILLSAAAAPMLAAPLVYLLRPTGLTPELSVGPGGGRVGVRGTF